MSASPIPDPIAVDFPLKGEWVAPNTPGKKVPSHGTDALGQRYAYDFIQVKPGTRGMRFYKVSPLRYLVFGARLQDCFAWRQTIYSPVDGTVVQVADGWPERQPVHLARDLALVLKHAVSFDPARTPDLRAVAGNYIIIETGAGYAFLAHARTGSIRVQAGETVARGQPLAEVGHSGNSTAPHLHFHLMDGPDLLTAQGIPCCFREYEVQRAGGWTLVRNGIPTDTDRIRNVNA